MLRVALTGGIGTGKTYIARLWQKNGISVFFADEEAKKLYLRQDISNWLITEFGTDDKKQLASLLFNHAPSLQKINAKIHPMVMSLFDEWTKYQSSTIVIMESAIVFEAKIETYFDLVVVVDAPLKTRIQRIKRRNPNWSEEDILCRIGRQLEQKEKCRKADVVINNEFGSDEKIRYKM